MLLKTKYFIISVVTILGFNSFLFAQEKYVNLPDSFYKNIKFEYLGIDDGLSSNNTAAVIQDQQGFLWIGTTDGGLNKYDGVQFINYINQPGNPKSLSNNYIWRLYLDKKGKIWTVSWGGGLSCYDPIKDTFINYQHDENDSSSLSSNLIWSVLIDGSDRLWVGTDNGLDRYDPVTQTFIHYRNIPGDPSSLSRNNVSMIKEDPKGFLWVSTYGGGLNKFDPETGRFTNHRISRKETSNKGHDFIWAMIQDSKGHIWLGSEGGLFSFDPKTETFARYLQEDINGKGYTGGLITEIFEDSQKKIWVGTSGSGLRLLNQEEGLTTAFRHDRDNPHSLADDTIWGIHEDDTGAIWFATFNGLNRYDEKNFRFNHYQRHPGVKNSLSANATQTFYEDENNILWIGTRGGGLNRFDPERRQFTHFLHDPENPDSLSNNTVLDIIPAANNAMWIGTSAGINLFDPQKQSFTRYQNNPNDPSTLNHGNVWDIDVSKDGLLWIGLYGGGLDRFDPKTGTFTHFVPEKNNAESLLSEWVTTVFVDHSGMVWVGTEGGISRLDPNTGMFANFKHDIFDPESISDTTIHTIFQDSRNRIWIGTNKGFNLYDAAIGKFKRYGTGDGLPGNTTASIIEDDRGNLWMGTNQGLSIFNPETNTFRNYDARDGLQGNQFLRKAALKCRGGQLFFGGVNGFNHFHPDALVNNPYIPPVKLTQFLLSNQPVPVNENTPLKEHINTAKKITLAHDQSTFSFRFAALNYLSPKKNIYAYKMEGFDKGWTYVDNTKPVATYTNLDPGNYLFRVKGSNNDGLWNNKGASISLVIIPPWWMTLWFKLVILALFGIGILGVHQLRVRGIKQEVIHRKQEAKRYKKTIESSIDGFWMLDTQGRILEVNQAYSRMTGYCRDELLSMSISDLEAIMSKQERNNLAQNLKKKGNARFETRHRHKNGNLIDVEISIAYSNGDNGLFFVFLRDITGLKKSKKETEILEKKLRQSQKMEAIGTLAGGIAHDFNNILFPIMGYTEILMDEVAPNSSSRQKLNAILKATLRARDLVSQILTFSRQARNESKKIMLQPIIKEALKLIRSTIPTTIEIEQDIQKDCCPIKADPTQIHQIIMNLSTNASHAMEKDGGKLEIILKELELDGFDVMIPNMKPGTYACLSVSDTGMGMDEELKSKIFDPFFTTKAKGKGTGMGLAVVHGIVTGMGGGIQVYSEQGKGTIFKLYFPEEKNAGFKHQDIKTEEIIRGGTESILLVDDEEGIIEMEGNLLRRLGYQVTADKSSVEALEMFRSDPDQFDLIITDMAMPQMSGDKLASELKKIRPDIPILLCTGFSEIMLEDEAAALGIDGFLMKPVMTKDLAQKIRDVLSGSSQKK